jgi:hypothetical protein
MATKQADENPNETTAIERDKRRHEEGPPDTQMREDKTETDEWERDKRGRGKK